MSADQNGPAGRAMRAAVFAVVCVYTALGMHMLAGGTGAGLGTVAAATAMTGTGAYVLARRRRSMGTLLAAAFAAQYGMHHLFGSGVPLAGHHGGGLSAAIGMLMAHVLVATLSAWWLERGDTALATLLLLLACSLRDLWRPLTDMVSPLATSRRVAPVVAVAPAIRPSQVLAWVLCRRGPPQ